MAPPAKKRRTDRAKEPASPSPSPSPEVSDAEDAYDEPEDTGSEAEDESGYSSTDSETYTQPNSKKRAKKHDPAAFSTSLTKILGSHLTTSKRSDPILVRSRNTNAKAATENALEAKAKRLIALEKKRELEKGRVRDLIPKDAEGAKRAVEKERRLRKVAQRGVVKLFNAVRAAQVKGELAEREVESKGVVSVADRKEKGEFYSWRRSDADADVVNSYGNVETGVPGAHTGRGEQAIVINWDFLVASLYLDGICCPVRMALRVAIEAMGR